MKLGAPQVGGVKDDVPKYIHKVGTGSPVLPQMSSPEFLYLLCFLLVPNYSGIHYNVHRYGHIPGALARTVGRIGGVHGIDTRCAVITTPAVFSFFSGLCDG